MDKKIEEVSANENFIVCEMVSLNGSDRYLYIYYRVTGGLNRNRKISEDVSAIIPLADEFLVITYTGTQSVIYSLEPEEAVLTQMYNLQDKYVISAAAYDENGVFLSTGGEVYFYDYYYNNMSLFLQLNSSDIFYEPLNSVLFYYDENGFGLFNFPEGQHLDYISFKSPVLNFHVIYNR